MEKDTPLSALHSDFFILDKAPDPETERSRSLLFAEPKIRKPSWIAPEGTFLACPYTMGEYRSHGIFEEPLAAQEIRWHQTDQILHFSHIRFTQERICMEVKQERGLATREDLFAYFGTLWREDARALLATFTARGMKITRLGCETYLDTEYPGWKISPAKGGGEAKIFLVEHPRFKTPMALKTYNPPYGRWSCFDNVLARAAYARALNTIGLSAFAPLIPNVVGSYWELRPWLPAKALKLMEQDQQELYAWAPRLEQLTQKTGAVEFAMIARNIRRSHSWEDLGRNICLYPGDDLPETKFLIYDGM